MHFSFCNINPKQGFLDNFGVRLQLANKPICYYTVYYKFPTWQHTEKLWFILSPHCNLRSKHCGTNFYRSPPRIFCTKIDEEPGRVSIAIVNDIQQFVCKLCVSNFDYTIFFRRIAKNINAAVPNSRFVYDT